MENVFAAKQSGAQNPEDKPCTSLARHGLLEQARFEFAVKGLNCGSRTIIRCFTHTDRRLLPFGCRFRCISGQLTHDVGRRLRRASEPIP